MSRRSELALALALFLALPARPARAQEDLDALRERFKTGMESYNAGRYADAILVWDEIYRDLGAQKGYRLSYNLGRAYDAYGNPTRAAEHYEIFLAEVVARRERAETIEPNVLEQETEAKKRLADLAAKNGRLQVKPGTRTHIARIDRDAPRVGAFVVYVAPGKHTVTIDDRETLEVDIPAGEIRTIDPPEAPEPKAPTEPTTTAPPPPLHRFESRTERPFSPTILWIAGGVTVASALVPAITYANALSIKSDYDASSTPRDRKQQLANDYDSARSTAYATLAIPGALLAATAGLATWYLLGTKDVQIEVAVGRVGVAGTF